MQEKILPNHCFSLLRSKDAQKTVFMIKDCIEKNLHKDLNLKIVTISLIVEVERGVNDYLDRNGLRTYRLSLKKPHLAEVSATCLAKIT